MPTGALNAIEGFYTLGTSVASYGDYGSNDSGHVLKCLLFFFTCVLQGCTMATLHFAIGIDPFYNMLYRQIECTNKCMLGACADDAATALRSFKHMASLAPTYDAMETFTNLVLKPAKIYFEVSFL